MDMEQNIQCYAQSVASERFQLGGIDKEIIVGMFTFSASSSASYKRLMTGENDDIGEKNGSNCLGLLPIVVPQVQGRFQNFKSGYYCGH